MPLHDFKCLVCNGIKEKFLKSRSGEVEVICDKCHIVMVKQISLPAKTATLWNDGWNSGLSGQGIYSQALGKKVHSRREEAKIMESRGFVSERDLGSHFIDDMMEKQKREKEKEDAISQRWLDNVKKFNGDKEQACVETFPAHEMLAQSE
jgi:hypothetical protein